MLQKPGFGLAEHIEFLFRIIFSGKEADFPQSGQPFSNIKLLPHFRFSPEVLSAC